MVKRCVVQFCSNSNKTGHTMQKFPKDANLKRQWVKFVQVKRADFVEPFEHSVVCNSHFSLDCYEKSYMVQMGLKKQKQLLLGAVPTIQALPEANSSEVKKRPIPSADSDDLKVADRTEKRPRRSRALQKLEVNRVSTKSIYVETLRKINKCN